jgi:hypothetical protein
VRSSLLLEPMISLRIDLDTMEARGGGRDSSHRSWVKRGTRNVAAEVEIRGAARSVRLQVPALMRASLSKPAASRCFVALSAARMSYEGADGVRSSPASICW